jgi:hypothetical protein
VGSAITILAPVNCIRFKVAEVVNVKLPAHYAAHVSAVTALCCKHAEMKVLMLSTTAYLWFVAHAM